MEPCRGLIHHENEASHALAEVRRLATDLLRNSDRVCFGAYVHFQERRENGDAGSP